MYSTSVQHHIVLYPLFTKRTNYIVQYCTQQAMTSLSIPPAEDNCIPGHHETDYIWDLVFKDKTWMKRVLSQGAYPVLIGDDLVRLLQHVTVESKGKRKGLENQTKPIIVLAFSDPKPVKDKELKSMLLESLGSEDYSVESLEVSFPYFTLHVGGVLQGHIDLRQPERLLEEGTSNTRLLYWKSKSPIVVETHAALPTLICLRHVEGERTSTWVIFTSTHEPALRRALRQPLGV